MFLLSKADATVFLKKFQWDLQHVSERLSENKEKLLMGLDFSSAVTDSNYGNKLFSVEKNLARLTLEARDLYGEYVVRSYLEENKGSMIKQCPAPGFSYFIEFRRDIDVEEYGLNVACLCGHTFCGRCILESHRPVTYNNTSYWLSRDLKKLSELPQKSLSISCIERNSKRYPHCQFSLEIDSRSRVLRLVECHYYSGRLCWECMQKVESHKAEGANADCVIPLLPLLVNGFVTYLDR
ncbi:putative E3 ubiquitin-protein ligase ARI13 [Raphanus sativus]|uniref:Probable E3 ubiquitin-protein ligase ARI13 n=1 Tax=Raphanus sativus TaxID=3726 RepID=A0A6J0JJD6_RAPSA|nr:probable E3 ubiquitin-protein ligase ARI13 [Raphanus sativus]KAJ4888760.1 putative E3 ubiquitin-protein ligase ARI13 [Raphanus sativus]